MKKIAYLIQILAVTVLFSSPAFAHDHDWGRHGHGWGHHHHENHDGWGGYPGRQVNTYYPQPQANYYYQQPPPTMVHRSSIIGHSRSTTMAGNIMITVHTKGCQVAW